MSAPSGASNARRGGGWRRVPPETSTLYDYVWYDDARQSLITYDGDTSLTQAGINNALHTSTFHYDGNGRAYLVNIADGTPRNVSFVTDAQGQVLRRTVDRGSGGPPPGTDPWTRYLSFDGMRVGEVTNDGPSGTDYAAGMNAALKAARARGTASGGNVLFQNGRVTAAADFDQAYQNVAPGSVSGAGAVWTVRDGDTLQGIAAAVWGDASLWYLIADQNGLTSASTLIAGQTLTLPAKVANVGNTSDTFRPYDPNKALGDLSPTQVKPPKQGDKGCGGTGQIIAIIIAVAVAAIVAPYAIAAVANIGVAAGTGVSVSAVSGALAAGTAGSLVGSTALIAGGAIAGAAASIASQAFSLATGMQDSFDWKGLALSAISGAVGGGLGAVNSLAGNGFGVGLARGAVNSVITQGIGVATGLQDSFSWTNVAVSAVVSGVSSGVAANLPNAGAPAFSAQGIANSLVSGGAGAFAGAATRSVLTGTNFGDNLIAVLPDVIGATIGNAIAGGVQELQIANAIRKRAERLGIPNDPDRNPGELAFLRTSVLQGTSDEIVAETYARPGVRDGLSRFNAGRLGISEEVQYNRVASYLAGKEAQQAEDLANGILSPTYMNINDKGMHEVNDRINSEGSVEIGDVIITGERHDGPGPLSIIENVVGGAVTLTGEVISLYGNNEPAANLVYGTTRILLSGGGGSALILGAGKSVLGSAGDKGVDYVSNVVQQETTNMLMYVTTDNPDFGFTVGAFGAERRITGGDMANGGGIVASMAAGFLLQQKLEGFVSRGQGLLNLVRGGGRRPVASSTDVLTGREFRRVLAEAPVSVPASKFDYLFGRASGSGSNAAHNVPRSQQLSAELRRLGIDDTVDGRNILTDHLTRAARDPDTFVRTYSDEFGHFEVKQSFLMGPAGRGAVFESTFRVLDDGTRQFITTIPRR